MYGRNLDLATIKSGKTGNEVKNSALGSGSVFHSIIKAALN
jgi:hypothetical protein